MFKHKLYKIEKELAVHHSTKSDILEKAVADRLDKALISYTDSLDKSYDYLKYRQDMRVLNKINRG